MDETTPTPRDPARTPWLKLPVLAAGLAALLLLAGIMVFWLGPSEESSFGWFAYAPLSGTTFVPGMHVLSSAHIIGWVLIALAACSAAFGAGLMMGRRAR